MKILYKVCFSEFRFKNRPLGNSMQDIISVCLTSVVSQMDKHDEIIFFLDGEDSSNILHNICNDYKVNYTIKKFNYGISYDYAHHEDEPGGGWSITKECISYIKDQITNEGELIYMCDDDHLHYNNCLPKIKDFLKTYPSYFCHPVDYPNLYEEETFQHATNQFSEIKLTKNHHWRTIKNTTLTFAFTKGMFNHFLHYKTFTSITEPLYWAHWQNLLFVFDKCFSPIPSLATHIEADCLSYCIDNKKIYESVNSI